MEEFQERRIALERNDAARKTLAEAIKRIEQLNGNETYQKAWKIALRALKSVQVNPA